MFVPYSQYIGNYTYKHYQGFFNRGGGGGGSFLYHKQLCHFLAKFIQFILSHNIAYIDSPISGFRYICVGVFICV